jgi:hypothetical protein
MHGQRAFARRPFLGRVVRIGVAVTAHDQVGAKVLDPRDLGRAGDDRHEDLGRHAQPMGRIGDRHTVIAAGCGHDSGGRHVTEQQVGERATRLERARALHQLQLERDRPASPPSPVSSASHAKIARVHSDNRCPAHVGRDHAVGTSDVVTRDERRGH